MWIARSTRPATSSEPVDLGGERSSSSTGEPAAVSPVGGTQQRTLCGDVRDLLGGLVGGDDEQVGDGSEHLREAAEVHRPVTTRARLEERDLHASSFRGEIRSVLTMLARQDSRPFRVGRFAPPVSPLASDARHARPSRRHPRGRAHRLDRRPHVRGAGETGWVVLEREARVGGHAATVSVDWYSFDLGPHILFASDPEMERLIRELLGSNLREQARRAWIYHEAYGLYTRFPFQAHLHGLPVPLVRDCLVDLVHAVERRARGEFAPGNYEDWMRGVFGDAISDRLMIPYARRLWTIEPAEMEFSWIHRRVPTPDVERIVLGALSDDVEQIGATAAFWYPWEGGAEALPRALAERVDGIELGRELVELDLDERTLRLADGDELGWLRASRPRSRRPAHARRARRGRTAPPAGRGGRPAPRARHRPRGRPAAARSGVRARRRRETLRRTRQRRRVAGRASRQTRSTRAWTGRRRGTRAWVER